MLIIILTIWGRNETNNTALKYNFEVFSESVLLKFVMFFYRKQPIRQLQFRGSTLTSPQINRRVKNFQVKLSFISLNTMSHKSVEFGLGIGNIVGIKNIFTASSKTSPISNWCGHVSVSITKSLDIKNWKSIFSNFTYKKILSFFNHGPLFL